MKEKKVVGGNLSSPGCGGMLAMKYFLEAVNEADMNVIKTMPACCWTVICGRTPETCMVNVPVLHGPFAAAAAMATGISVGLKRAGKHKNTKAVAWAGDGGTYDIGLQALSGALDRRTNFMYVCYNNGAYMNTGVQCSSATPYGAKTTTTPKGRTDWAKNLPEILAAHREAEYIATAAFGTAGQVKDLKRKVTKALQTEGPVYLEILSPCPPGWKMSSDLTLEVARKAVSTGAYPLFEVELLPYRDLKWTINYPKKKLESIEEYLELQGRFSSVMRSPKMIREIQKQVNKDWARLNVF